MNNCEDLEHEVEMYLHNLWKQTVRTLLIGKHLSETKRTQYSRGMCKFDLLEPQYKKTYRRDATNLINICGNHLDAFIEINFNGEEPQ